MIGQKGFFKNILMVLSSNLIVLGLGVVISFALPLYLSIESYGYWQLYNYYQGFVGLFMFGFSDGMNLRYAGNSLKDLNLSLFQSFLRFTVSFSLVLSLILLAILSFFPSNDYKTIFFLVILNIFLFNVNGYFIHLNQMTLRFKQYSVANSMERVLFILFLVPLFLNNIRDYSVYIWINILCRMLTLFYNISTLKEVAFYKKGVDRPTLIPELKANFLAGFPLTLASICSMLMTTMPRFVISSLMSITVFGIFSFGSTTINLVIQIILAMSTVFYPTLMTMSDEQIKKSYLQSKKLLSVVGAITLLTYYLVYPLIQVFFKKYIPVLDYLYLLFPTLFYQSFNSLIISNFARVLRLEKKYFFSNLLFMGINFGFSYFVGYSTHSIPLILISSLITMQLWISYGEAYISKEFGIASRDWLALSSIVIFCISNFLFGYYISLVIYFIVALLYGFQLFKNHKDLLSRFTSQGE